MENTPSSENLDNEVKLSFKRPTKRQIAWGVGIVAVLAVLFYARGFLIAATVNGSIVSRWSVIRELESRSGSQALESMITKKLIDMELEKQKIEISDEEITTVLDGIKAQVASQGGTFAEALEAQGLTEDALREQIVIQKKVEKLLADKTVVTDADVAAYIKENKLTAPKGTSADDFKAQINDQLQQQKFQEASQDWISELTTSATITRYFKY